MDRWFTVDVDRLLYVDRGVDTILCDRHFHPGPVTVVVKLSDEAISNLLYELHKTQLSAISGQLPYPAIPL